MTQGPRWMSQRLTALLGALLLLVAVTAVLGYEPLAASGVGLIAAGTLFADDDLGKRLKALGMISQVVSINPDSIASGAEGTATAEIAGLTPDHVITVSPLQDMTVGIYVRGAYCATPGELTVDLVNTTGGGIDHAAFNVAVIAFPKLA